MNISAIIIASCLSILGVAHSFLGEREILAPLFKEPWQRPAPRWAMQRILRFAWHLTSIAWFGLAATVLGVELYLAITGIALASALIIFIGLRGHLAWPLFALAGLAALYEQGYLTSLMLSAAASATLLCILSIAALHVYWAVGGRWGLASAIPTTPQGRPAFRPPAWLTALVAIALLIFAALVAWTWLATSPPFWSRIFLSIAIAVLTLRAIGDGKQVGFSKSQRNSDFAKWDDRLFTPLVVFMAFGSGAALLS